MDAIRVFTITDMITVLRGQKKWGAKVPASDFCPYHSAVWKGALFIGYIEVSFYLLLGYRFTEIRLLPPAFEWIDK
jgi:hypothetical protein